MRNIYFGDNNSHVTITNCTSAGNISIKITSGNTYYAAAIAAFNNPDPNTRKTITGCTKSDNVSITVNGTSITVELISSGKKTVQ